MEEENLPLENKWCFWFDKGQKQKLGGGKDPYLERLKKVGVVNTVVEFWKHFNHLRVEEMRLGNNLMLFKADLDPVWEHPGNAHGGKWVLPLAGCDVAWVWETCVLHAIGEQFSMSESVCGVVLMRRSEPRGDSLCLWNNDCRQREQIERMGEELRATLKLPATAAIVYQPHKGHIDFGQQHPPLPPQAKRRSSRRSSKESSKDVSPSQSNRASASASPQVTPPPLPASTRPVVPPVTVVPPVIVAAVPTVTVTMDVEHCTTVLSVAPRPSPDERPSAAGDGAAALLLPRGRAPAPAPTVLVVRRPRSPVAEAINEKAASAASPVVAKAAKTKKGRQLQKAEAERAAAERAAAEREAERVRRVAAGGRAGAAGKNAAEKKATDPTLLAVAAVGVLVGLLSLVFMLRM